jgi:hypothetical protein
MSTTTLPPITVEHPTFGTETHAAAQHLADAAWKLRNGYSPGGSTVTGAVAQLCDNAARAIDPTVRTTYAGRYPAARGHGEVELDITELTYEERVALPARYHRPYFQDLSTPSYWMCTACWSNDGDTTAWPCKPATTGGLEVARACGLEYSA